MMIGWLGVWQWEQGKCAVAGSAAVGAGVRTPKKQVNANSHSLKRTADSGCSAILLVKT